MIEAGIMVSVNLDLSAGQWPLIICLLPSALSGSDNCGSMLSIPGYPTFPYVVARLELASYRHHNLSEGRWQHCPLQ